MAVQTKICGTGGVQAFVGSSTVWSDPTNIQVDDDQVATSDLANGGLGGVYTEFLRAYNFGFTIPLDATIDGIIVHVKKIDYSGIGGYVKDKSVRLRKGAIVTGDNNADTVSIWAAEMTTVDYGSASSLWSVSGGLLPSDVNDATFSAVFSAQSSAGGGAIEGVAGVDYISISCYYTPPPPYVDYSTKNSKFFFFF